jgi:CheY-like chemotaxis protein
MQTGIPEFESVFILRNSQAYGAQTGRRYDGLFVAVTGASSSRACEKMEETAPDESAVVFVIENSADYMYQLEQGFRKAALPIDLKIARYGNEAVLYLKGVGIYGDRTTYPLPRVVILDLDLPDGSPLAVLGWIRQQSELAGVAVITTGFPGQYSLFKDAREMGAVAWFPKSDFAGIIHTVESLIHVEPRDAEDGREAVA